MSALRVSVAIALPGWQEVVALELPAGATVADALRAARVAARAPQLDLESARFGIWSRPCERDTPLRDGDRVEVYRALRADPKSLRRERARLRPTARSRSRR